MLCGRDSFAGHQNVEDWIFSNVAHCLLVGDHSEVIAIALQYFVMDSQARVGRRTPFVDFRHINALKPEQCWTKSNYMNGDHLRCLYIPEDSFWSPDRCRPRFWSHTLKFPCPPRRSLSLYGEWWGSGKIGQRVDNTPFMGYIFNSSYRQTLHGCPRLVLKCHFRHFAQIYN